MGGLQGGRFDQLYELCNLSAKKEIAPGRLSSKIQMNSTIFFGGRFLLTPCLGPTTTQNVTKFVQMLGIKCVTSTGEGRKEANKGSIKSCKLLFFAVGDDGGLG